MLGERMRRAFKRPHIKVCRVSFAGTQKAKGALMLLAQTWAYALAHRQDLMHAVRAHLSLCVSALVIAALIGVPLGIWTARARSGRAIVSALTAVRVIPSLAVLALMLPVLGIGFAPALVALIILACPPILINTDVAFRDIDPAVREAAVGMGMRNRELVRRIEYPLAFPVVIAGLRTSTVEVIASATLAAFIGAGGLGDLILNGLANNDYRQLLLGAVTVALLALVAETLLGAITRIASRRYGRTAVV